MAASPKASANPAITVKFYLLLTPLPPDTTTLAVVSSGLLESPASSLINLVFMDEGGLTSSTAGEPWASGASSKLEGLKVRKLNYCSVLTLFRAFPAYVGLR